MVKLISWANSGRSFKVKTKIKKSPVQGKPNKPYWRSGRNNTCLGYQHTVTSIASVLRDYTDLLNCEGSRTRLSLQTRFG